MAMGREIACATRATSATSPSYIWLRQKFRHHQLPTHATDLIMKSIPETSIEQLRGTAKILQVVTIAMTFATLMGLVVVIGMVPEALNQDPKMLVLLAAFTGMVMYGLSFVIGSIFNDTVSAKNAENADDTATEEQVNKAASQISNAHVIRSAIIEAAIILNLMVLLLERNYISIAVIVLGLLLLVSLFPSHGRLIRAIERRLK